MRGRIFVAVALASALAARASLAQVPTGAALEPATHDVPAGPVRVWLDTRAGELDAAQLQAALSRELGREVVIVDDPAQAAVQVRVEPSRAFVDYETASGQKLARSVDLPPDRQRSVEVVTWLTVNLVRDEASELLDELRARRREEKAAADKAAADKAAAEQAAADKAAAEQAAADKAAADKAAADEAARKRAEQAQANETNAGGTPKKDGTDGLLREPLKSVDVAFATPLSLLRDSPKRELKLQLSLVYGEAGAIRGIATGMGVIRVRQHLEGMAHGLAAVLVAGRARGVVAAVGFSELGGNLEGILIGAGAAIQRGKLARGLVISVGGALSGEMDGGLIGGGFTTARSLRGFGVAGGANVIRGPSSGPLVAGGVNLTGDHRGLLVAGGVNVAGDLRGIAIAPLNVQRRVRGVQVGVINVADEVDGAAIGVLSLSKSGKFQPTVWAASDGSTHVALKSTVGWAFTQLGAGINLSDDTFSYDGGVGLHLKLGGPFFVEPGVHYSGHHQTADASGSPDEHQLHYVALGGVRVGSKVDFLLGGGLRQTVAGGTGAALAPEGRAAIAFF